MKRTLEYWVDWYFETRDTCEHYRRSVKQRALSLEEFAKRPLELSDLSDSLINRWIIHLQENTALSSKTIKDYREAVLQVWRAAAMEGEVATEPRRIRSIRIAKQTPTAWHLPELALLMDACRHLPGTMKGTTIPRSLWYRGHFEVLWDTGVRRSDGVAIRRRDIRPGNVIYIVQAKTGEPIPKRLRPDTIDTLNQIAKAGNLGPDDRLTPLECSWRQYEHWLRWVVAKAGIRKGRTKWIRRAASSYVERDHPGKGRLFLGHKSANVAEDFYFDPSIVSPDIPLPPPIPKVG